MTILYGISNCDTVRKARRWLTEHGIDYRFHDLRRDGLDSRMLRAWERQLGWEQMLNRRGTTWRKLPVSNPPSSGARCWMTATGCTSVSASTTTVPSSV